MNRPKDGLDASSSNEGKAVKLKERLTVGAKGMGWVPREIDRIGYFNDISHYFPIFNA